MTLLTPTTNATPGATGPKAASKHPGVITKGSKASVGVKATGVAKHPATRLASGYAQAKAGAEQ